MTAQPSVDPAAALLTGDDRSDYTARHLLVLEGLEAVRKRPGMYIGSTDGRGLMRCLWEIIDNSVDEALVGYGSAIEVELRDDGSVEVRDNGRGIPVDDHPKHPGMSALEVILTMLHSGGKFSGKAYDTSGGLHGVGLSVVNALSDSLVVEVARDRQLFRQRYSRGKPLEKLQTLGSIQNRRGTSIRSTAGLIVKLAGMAVPSPLRPGQPRHFALLTCMATVRSLFHGTTLRSGRLAQMFL